MKNKFLVICLGMLAMLLSSCGGGTSPSSESSSGSGDPSITSSTSEEELKYKWTEQQAEIIKGYAYNHLIPHPQLEGEFKVSYNTEEKYVEIFGTDVIKETKDMTAYFNLFNDGDYRYVTSDWDSSGDKTLFAFNKELVDSTGKKRVIQVLSYVYDENHPYQGWKFFLNTASKGNLAIIIKDSNYDFPVEDAIYIIQNRCGVSYKNPILPPVPADNVEKYESSQVNSSISCYYTDPKDRDDGGYTDILKANAWSIYENTELSFFVASSPDLAYTIAYTYNHLYHCLNIRFERYIEVRKFEEKEWSIDVLAAIFSLMHEDYYKIPALVDVTSETIFTYFVEITGHFSFISVKGQIEITNINKSIVDGYFDTLSEDGWTLDATEENRYRKMFKSNEDGLYYDYLLDVLPSVDNSKLFITFYFYKESHDFTSWPTNEIREWIYSNFKTNDNIPVFKRSFESLTITEKSIVIYFDSDDNVESNAAYYESLLDEDFICIGLPDYYNSPNRQYSIDISIAYKRFYLKFADPYNEGNISKGWPTKLLEKTENLGEKASLIASYTADRYTVSSEMKDDKCVVTIQCIKLNIEHPDEAYWDENTKVHSYLSDNYELDYSEDGEVAYTYDGSLRLTAIARGHAGIACGYLTVTIEVTVL